MPPMAGQSVRLVWLSPPLMGGAVGETNLVLAKLMNSMMWISAIAITAG